MKKGLAFMKKHPAYNAMVHAVGGIGIGVLITYPLVGVHPVRIAIVFIVLSLLGLLYAMFA